MDEFKTTAPVYKNFGVDMIPAPFEDTSVPDTKYIGWAPIGVGENDQGWLIMREKTEDGITKREYANSKMEFNCKWTERTSYSYGR